METIILSAEEQQKLVSLERLAYYDDKLKKWVLKQTAGSMTEEQLREIVDNQVKISTELEII